MSSGFLKVTSGKTRTALNGGGGSGEPTTLEVVHGLRGGAAGGFASGCLGSSAGEPDHVASAEPASSTRTTAAREEETDIAGVPERDGGEFGWPDRSGRIRRPVPPDHAPSSPSPRRGEGGERDGVEHAG